MELFEQEFEGVPPVVKEKLLRQIEDAVRKINQRYGYAIRDHTIQHFTFHEVCGIIRSVFDLAQNFRQEHDDLG